MKKKLKLLLDAGHGGHDTGAVSKDGLEFEKDLNYAIVEEIMRIWEERYPDWEVVFTRAADMYVSPGERKRTIQNEKPTASVSIHCNAATSATATGVETIYRDSLDEPLAKAVQTELTIEFPGLRDRGVKTDIGDLRRSLAVLDSPGIPSILVECGFISNANDLKILHKTTEIAEAVVRGVAKWHGL